MKCSECRRKLSVLISILSIVVGLSSRPASAQCLTSDEDFGVNTATTSVHSIKLPVETVRGPATASIDYKIQFTHELCERHTASIHGHTVCLDVLLEAILLRVATVTWSDGSSVNADRRNYALSPAKALKQPEHCIDVEAAMSRDRRELEEKQVDTWIQGISDDRKDIDLDLEQLSLAPPGRR